MEGMRFRLEAENRDDRIARQDADAVTQTTDMSTQAAIFGITAAGNYAADGCVLVSSVLTRCESRGRNRPV